MDITLSYYAGFCDGVDRAYKIVEKIANDRQTKKPVFVLGSLVHNEDVVSRLEKMGIKKLNVDFFDLKSEEFSKIKIGTIVITAHGVGPRVYEFFKKKKIDIVDTTCPKVIKVQRLAKNFSEKKYQVVIIGEKNHKEARGIFEWANKEAFFVENEKDLEEIKLDPKKKIAVVSQTTQSKYLVEKASNFIQKKYPQAELIDTLCPATHNRQGEIKKIAAENDVVIVIGSRESSNSTRLWEIAKNINKNSYFIDRAADLKKEWFIDCRKIGVTAGASTPKWIIDGVLRKLKTF